jgi:hypothetical protein
MAKTQLSLSSGLQYMKAILFIISFSGILFFFIGCESNGRSAELAVNYSAKKSFRKDTSLHNLYCWLSKYDAGNMLLNRIPVPEGYERTKTEKGSFPDWLRHLPLKTGNPEVLLYNGEQKHNQSAQFAVLNIDVGKEDLQQCADAVMRLKSEYHFSKKEKEKIHFKFTSGDNAEYSKWAEGYRPSIKGNKVSWIKSATKDNSYTSFKAYLRQVFMYAGSSSLSKEMQPIELTQMQAGDVFIRGGFPGHAVIVLDMAVNPLNGKKIFMLAQSYMPAQDIHILKNPTVANTPWYPLDFKESFETPEWTFEQTDLKRFK